MMVVFKVGALCMCTFILSNSNHIAAIYTVNNEKCSKLLAYYKFNR